MFDFRPLRADEIEVRVAEARSTTNGKYVSLLLYKTARTDMQLFTETYGQFNWKNEYREINGKMYCKISVWNDTRKEWISKENVGSESNMEAEKGEASDAMKRAGFVWGCGTELYSAPRITVWDDKANIRESDGKCKCFDRFFVDYIEYSDTGKIVGLRIGNETKNTLAFEYNVKRIERPKTEPKVEVKAEVIPTVEKSEKRAVCEDCGAEITEKVFSYSKSKYGKALCMNCQKNHK